MARSFHCPSCDWEGYPSFDLNTKGKLVAKCGRDTCDYVDASLGPADFNEGLLKDGTRVDTKSEPPPGTYQPRAPYAAPATVTAPPKPHATPGDVIGMIRQRRDYLALKVAEGEAAKFELRKLEKMLKAADRVEAEHRLATETTP